MPTLNLTLLADDPLPLVRRLGELAAHLGPAPLLLVDLDPAGTVSGTLGVAPGGDDLTAFLRALTRGEDPALEPQTGFGGIPIVPPGRELGRAWSEALGAGTALGGALNPIDRVAEAIEALAEDHEVVVIIVDPRPTALQAAALAMAEDIVLLLSAGDTLEAQLDQKVRQVQRIARARGARSAHGLVVLVDGLTPPPGHWRLVHSLREGPPSLPEGVLQRWDDLEEELGEHPAATVMIDITTLPHPQDSAADWIDFLGGLLLPASED